MGAIDNRILGYTNAVVALDKMIIDAEKHLSELQSRKNKILIDDIPTLLEEFGLSEIKSSNGVKVKLEHIYSVMQKDKIALRDWLDANGMGAIIKEELEFVKGGADKKLFKFLEKGKYHYNREVNVNTNSLKAQLKQHIESGGEQPPVEAAEIEIFTRAKITLATKDE